MNNELMQQILNEEESTTLDFKKEQYPFQGVSDNKKGELLKDIISFANAWRRTDSYILIGVEEVKGGRSKVHGVQNHLDDAQLQQFVNNKTNRPVTFLYEAFPSEAVQVGIIKIPLQTRPIFLTKDYGNLKKNVVYIRRGSSTDIANPDEITKMSQTSLIQEYPTLDLELQLANPQIRNELGTSIEVASSVLEPLDESEVPIAGEQSRFSVIPDMFDINKNYYKEMIPYVFYKSILKPIGFVIENNSPNVALDVVVKVSGRISDDFYIFDETQLRTRPIYQESWLFRQDLTRLAQKITCDIYVNVHGDVWLLESRFGKIQPKSKKWSEDVFYIGATKSTELEFEASIFADNLPHPIKVPISIEFKTTSRKMTIDDLKNVPNEE